MDRAAREHDRRIRSRALGWLFVAERRQGTLIRLRAAPITRGQLLLGKLIPCLLLSIFQGLFLLVAGNLVFGMSWGPVVWVLLGEMFPNRIRAAALSVAAAGQWVANWVITVSFPPLKDVSLGLAYGLYATFAILSFLFVSRFVRETKGAQLEDMHDDLSGPDHAASPTPRVPNE